MSQQIRITSYVGGHPPVGVDNSDDRRSTPVVSDGEEQVWTIVRRDGRAFLHIGNYEAVPNGDKVEAVWTIGIPRPFFEWELRKVNEALPVENYYIIDSATSRAWTLGNPAPKTQIELQPYNPDHLNPSQWFTFNPAN